MANRPDDQTVRVKLSVGCENSCVGIQCRNPGNVPDGCSRAKLRVMKSGFSRSTNPLIAKIDQLFNCDLALENDYLRQENRILRSKFGRRVPLTEADRRILVKYGLRIKERLPQIVATHCAKSFVTRGGG